MQMEIPVETIHAALETAKKHHVLSILNPAPYRPLSPQDIALASIVTPNETEAKLMLGMSAAEPADPQTLGLALDKAGVHRCAITLGKRGVLVMENGRWELVDAFPVQAVDTTGAGDIFGGSALWQLLQQSCQPGALEEAALRQTVRFAAVSAGLSTTRPGGLNSVPDYGEVLARLETFQG